MGDTITRRELIQQLASLWGVDNPNPFPFVIEKGGVNSDDFKFDMDGSYLSFTCCGTKDHKYVKTPREILAMMKENTRVPCEKCRALGVTADNDDDLLPGEEVVGIPLTEAEKQKLKDDYDAQKAQEAPQEEVEEEPQKEKVEETVQKPTTDLHTLKLNLQQMTDVLGYVPFEESSLSIVDDKYVQAHCRICDHSNLIPIDQFNTIYKFGKDKEFAASSCLICKAAIDASKQNFNNYINGTVLDRISESLSSLEDYDLAIEEEQYWFESGYFDPATDSINVVDRETGDRYEIEIDSLLDITKEYDSVSMVIISGVSDEDTSEDEEEFGDSLEDTSEDEEEFGDSLEEDDEDDYEDASDEIVEDEIVEEEEDEIDETNNQGREDFVETSEAPIKREVKSPFSFGDEDDFEVEIGDSNSGTNMLDNLFGKQSESKVETKTSSEPKEGKSFFEKLFGGSTKEESVTKAEDSPKAKASTVVQEDDFEVEIGDTSLGKTRPVDGTGRKSADHSNSRIRDLHQQDPLQRHIDERNDELKHKWYNTRVYTASDYNDADFNELIDEENLVEEFENSPTGKLLRAVRTRTEIESRLSLNDDTFQLPIVDFATGVRVICLSVNDESQMKTPLQHLIDYPFQFDRTGSKEGIRKVFLYSDSVESSEKKFKATLKSLIKIVGRDSFDPRRIINIGDNYMLFYVTDKKIIDDFEAEHSTYPMGKPCNKSVAIIAMKHDSFKKKLQPRDILNMLNKDNFDMRKYNLHMVASARYIENLNVQAGTVEYRITDYLEMTSTILLDGFEHVVGAILKEHAENHLGKPYNITFEFDQSLMSSPSLEKYYDQKDMIPIGEYGNQFCYVRKSNYRRTVEDTYRQDSKLFAIRTLGIRFKDELRNSMYNITIKSQRDRFIESMGFEKVYQPAPKVFFLSPLFTTKLSMKPSVLTLSKIDLSVFFQGSGIYSGGYDNLLIQRMLLDQMSK